MDDIMTKRVLHTYIDPLLFFRKLFKLDIHYFASSSFYSLLQQIVGVTIGLIVSYIFGHYVTKLVFGEYNFILSTVSLLTFLSLPGINDALTQTVGRGFDRSY